MLFVNQTLLQSENATNKTVTFEKKYIIHVVLDNFHDKSIKIAKHLDRGQGILISKKNLEKNMSR